MRLLACSASIAFSPAQANCLSLGEINSSQLVIVYFYFPNVMDRYLYNLNIL
jgi:hypothetical protein